MNTEEYPQLPESVEKYIQLPYGGLFGDAVIVRVVQEIVANPNRQYTQKYLERVTGRSQPQIKTSLETLVDLKLLFKTQSDTQRPIYEVNIASNQLMALTFLAYSAIDDRKGTTCMKDAIFEYCDYCKFESKIKTIYESGISVSDLSTPSPKTQFQDYDIHGLPKSPHPVNVNSIHRAELGVSLNV